MKTTIVIDDVDATLNPAYPWTANAYDEDGELLSNPGFGMSRREAVLELIDHTVREMPAFGEPLLPQLNEAQTIVVNHARVLMAQNMGRNDTQLTYRTALIDLVAGALTIDGVEDSDDHRMVVERMLQP